MSTALITDAATATVVAGVIHTSLKAVGLDRINNYFGQQFGNVIQTSTDPLSVLFTPNDTSGVVDQTSNLLKAMELYDKVQSEEVNTIAAASLSKYIQTHVPSLTGEPSLDSLPWSTNSVSTIQGITFKTQLARLQQTEAQFKQDMSNFNSKTINNTYTEQKLKQLSKEIVDRTDKFRAVVPFQGIAINQENITTLVQSIRDAANRYIQSLYVELENDIIPMSTGVFEATVAPVAVAIRILFTTIQKVLVYCVQLLEGPGGGSTSSWLDGISCKHIANATTMTEAMYTAWSYIAPLMAIIQQLNTIKDVVVVGYEFYQRARLYISIASRVLLMVGFVYGTYHVYSQISNDDSTLTLGNTTSLAVKVAAATLVVARISQMTSFSPTALVFDVAQFTSLCQQDPTGFLVEAFIASVLLKVVVPASRKFSPSVVAAGGKKWLQSAKQFMTNVSNIDPDENPFMRGAGDDEEDTQQQYIQDETELMLAILYLMTLTTAPVKTMKQ